MAGITTILTINSVAYANTDRANSRLKIDGLSLNLTNQNDSLSFHEEGCLPTPTWNEWMAVSLAMNIGSGSVVRFSGVIVDTQSSDSAHGWTHAYTVNGLRFLADKLVPIEAPDQTGTITYNRPHDDQYYIPTDSGLTIGTMFSRLLKIQNTANRLNAVGVGGYTSLSPPTLPAATVADLALLTVVPVQSTVFQGKNIISAFDQVLARWMPKFVCQLLPSGVFRFKDTTDISVFIPQTITLPSRYAQADPIVQRPRIRRSSEDCATRLMIRGGPEVEAAMLATSDGTLVEVFTTMDKSTWTYYDFIQPKKASDYGSVSAVTSTSATISSHDATRTWVTNFWSSNDAVITLINSVASGINEIEARVIDSCTSMSAGGSSTVNWDSNWPISNAGYTSYRIAGSAGGLIDTWRTYEPREPHTGAVGLSTYIGAHLVIRSNFPVNWANGTQSFSVFTTQATIFGDTVPVGIPAIVQPVPSAGIFRFRDPTVAAFGQIAQLKKGSPTTVAQGLPSDVQILALYSRGALSAVWPADISGVPQYSGTAEPFMHVTEYMDIPSFLWKNDTASLTILAQQHLASINNINYDINIDWDVDATGLLPSWSFLDFDSSLNIDIAGYTWPGGGPNPSGITPVVALESPWAATQAPIRGVNIVWNTNGSSLPGIHRISFVASTRRRPYSGDDLYIHPAFAMGTPLSHALDGSGGFMGSSFLPPMPSSDALGNALRSSAAFIPGMALGGPQPARAAGPDLTTAEGIQQAFAGLGLDMANDPGATQRRDDKQRQAEADRVMKREQQASAPHFEQKQDQVAQQRTEIEERNIQKQHDAEAARMAAIEENQKKQDAGEALRARSDDIRAEREQKREEAKWQFKEPPPDQQNAGG